MRNLTSKRMMKLISALSVEEGSSAETAQFDLQDEFGFECLEEVVKVYPGLQSWGKTCALDLVCWLSDKPMPSERARSVIEEFASSTLKEDSSLLRQFSAEILGDIKMTGDLSCLLDALERAKMDGISPHELERSAIRHALRKQGISLRYDSESIRRLLMEGLPGDYWLGKSAEVVLAELLRNRQMICGLQVWRKDENGAVRWVNCGVDSLQSPDYSMSFGELVEVTNSGALEYLKSHRGWGKLLVSLDWLAEEEL